MAKCYTLTVFIAVFFVLLFISFNSYTYAQVTATSSGYTPTELVEDVLMGGSECVAVSNITYVGNGTARGYFSGGQAPLGFESGVILASGDVANANGPNNNGGTGSSFGGSGDGDLNILQTSSYSTFDAAILEFDFVPTTNVATFNYVFGSEEYCEYSPSSFSDVFGFFISGPGISGPFSNSAVNIALIPGTSTAVSINNVNEITNTTYFIGNSSSCPSNNGLNVEYDGLTIVLQATTPELTPCQTYHIKLAISDCSDTVLDSGVFLEEGSFDAGDGFDVNTGVGQSSGINLMYEGCQTGYFVFTREDTTDTSAPYTITGINVDTGSSATPGVDCNTIPTDFTIPAGLVRDTLWIDAYFDTNTEGIESLILNFPTGCPCAASTITKIMLIKDADPVDVEVTASVNPICPNDPVTLTATITGGAGISTEKILSWSTGDGNVPSINIAPATTTTYMVTVTDLCLNTDTDTITITVLDNPTPVNIIDPGLICLMPSIIDLEADSSGGVWSGAGITDAAQGLFDPTLSSPPYTITYTYTNMCGIVSNDVIDLNVANLPTANFSGDITICDNAGATADLTINLTGVAPWNLTYNDPVNGATTITILTSPYTLTVNAADTYTITNVTDALPCSNTGGNANVVLVDISIAFSATDPICNNDANGTINATASGGQTPYNYAWSDTTIGNTPNATNLLAGTYYITVTDSNGCFDSASYTLNNPLLPNTPLVSNPPNYCQSDSLATISATTPLGTQPAWYLLDPWTNPGTPPIFTGDPFDPATQINNNTPGTYNFWVTSLAPTGCISNSVLVTVTILPLPVVPVNNIAICQNDSVAIDALNGGGSGVYVWYDAPLPGGNIVSGNISPATTTTYYTVFTDTTSGCSNTNSATITVNTLPSPQITGQAIICQNDSIDLTASGGSTYLWSTTQTTPTISITTAGTYTVTVTDGNNCSAVATHTVTLNNLAASATATNILCPGDVGSITVNATGGASPYTYLWTGPSPVGDQANASNIMPGQYTIVVTDANLCTATITVDLFDTSNPMAVAPTTTDAACNGQASGSINLNLTGGVAPVVIVWSGPSAIPNNELNPDSLLAGNYTANITDANNCNISTTITINEPALLTVSFNIADPLCNGGNGTIQTQVQGGTAPHTYLWSPGNQTTDQITATAGTYSVTVTDAKGCTASGSATINEPPALAITNAAINPEFCDQANGEIMLTTTGGTGALSFAWSPNAGNSNYITNLTQGNYTVTVTDANGCNIIQSFTVDFVAGPTADAPLVIDAACGQATGSVQLVINGGLSPYTYNWAGLPTVTGDYASDLPSGIYDITVTDQNNCPVYITATINNFGAPAIDSITVLNDACDQGIGALTVYASGGTGLLTYNFSDPFQDGDNYADNLPWGNYTVTVTDEIGCEVVQSITINNDPGPTVDEVATIQPHCGQPDGSALVVATGGTGNLFYAWSNDNGYGFNEYNNLTAGTYTVTVTDQRGCFDVVTFDLIDEPAPIIEDIALDPDYCGQGLGTATVTLSPLGNTNLSELTFQWSHDGNLNGLVASGLIDGNYTVSVLDNFGCIATQSFTIGDIAGPVITLKSKTNETCSASNGSLEINVAGGTGTPTYVWDPNIGNTGILNSLPAGTYSVTVTDAKGCTATETYTITDAPGPQLTLSGTTDAHCGQAIGAVKVLASGGLAPLTFKWSHNPALNAADALNIQAGNYTVTVTDANGCTDTLTATVNDIAGPSLNLVSTINETCSKANGEISIQATGGVMPYTYKWADDALKNTALRTNLSAGSYTVTVTDAFNCIATETYTITNSPPATALVSTAPSSCGQSDGAASVLMTGGTPPFVYNWSNGANTDVVTGLKAGAYTVTVTDSNGCQTVGNANISDLNAPTLTVLNVTNPTCQQSNGSAEVTASGGVGTLIIEWSIGGVGNIMSGQPAGTYSVTVTDDNGCKDATTIDLIDQPSPTLTLTNITKAACGQANGSATLTALGGTGALTYTWTPSVSSGNSSNSLPQGNYNVVVTDENGCTASIDFTIEEDNAPTINVVGTTPAGCATADGSATVQGLGGTAPLTYAWSHDLTLNSTTANNIAAGNYTVTVTDAKGCAATVALTVNTLDGPAITSIDIAAAICGNDNGTATVNFTNGTSPFTFTWSHDATLNNATASGLAAGTYSVTITDSKNCTVSQSFDIMQQPSPVLSLVTKTDPTCTTNNGAIEVAVSGGTGTVSLSWLPNVSSNSVATNLAPGNYTITATDENNCTATINVTLTDQPGPTATFTVIDAHCGKTDGSINIVTNGGTNPIVYTWSDAALSGNNPTGIKSGNYTVTISDQNACEFILNIPVADIPGPSVVLNTVTNSSCGQSDGSASVTASGGTGALIYTWSPNVSNTAIANNLASGLYNLTVTDQAGCEATIQITVKDDNAPELSITSTNPEICNKANGDITVNAIGGDGNYTFTWSHDASLNSATATGLTTGNYSVTVTDGNGCKDVIATDVLFVDGPNILINTFTDDYCVQGIGTINTLATGGTGGYTYAWSQDATLNNANAANLLAGNYTVSVTDANNCTATATQLLANIDGPALSIDNITPANCNQADGMASVIATGGTGSYTYAWSQNNSLNSPSATDLAEGSYTVTVTDSKGCTVTLTVDVPNLNGPKLNTITATPATCGTTEGAATVTIIDGTNPMSYLWNTAPPQTTATATNLLPGNYSVTVTDANGCTVIANVVVDGLSPETVLSCGNITETTVEFVWTAVSGALEYEITIDGGAPFKVSAATLSYLVTGLATQTSVVCTVLPIMPATCEAGITQTVTCTTLDCPPLDLTVEGWKPEYCSAEAGVQLIPTPNGGIFTGAGVNASGWFDPAQAGAGVHTITYNYTSAINCPYSTTIEITVYEQPVAAFTHPDIICLGDAATFTFTGSAAADATFNWSISGIEYTGIGPHEVILPQSGMVPVVLTVDVHGCTNTVESEIGVSAVTVSTLDDTSIFYGESLTLTTDANSMLNGSLEFLWNATYEPLQNPLLPINVDISGSTAQSPEIKPSATGFYLVEVVDEYGCKAMDTVKITVLLKNAVLAPNAFSPNNDGLNDIFNVNGANIESVDLIVFDRWGNQVFEGMKMPYLQGWDGNHKNQPAAVGVYVFNAKVYYFDGTTGNISGNLTLLR